VSEFRLLTRPEMEAIPRVQEPLPGSFFAVGMTDEQGLAAACGVFLVVHSDPIWIRPDLRNSGKLLLRLWEATSKEIAWRRLGPEVFVGMTDTNPGQPTEGLVERMCLAAGGAELKARFFTVPVSDNG